MPRAYRCRLCKHVFAHDPEGACPNCGRFCRRESIFVGDGEIDGAEGPSVEDGQPVSANDLMSVYGDRERTETGLKGVDWIFNGGLPQVGTILLCAPQGVGKTTFLLILFRALAKLGIRSMFISSEQDLETFAQQFSWLGKFPSKMLIHHEEDRDAIIESIEKNHAKVYALDSLHDVRNITDDAGFDLASGQPTAIKEVGHALRRLAKDRHALIFAIGHVNNDGTIAGGAHIRHMLDAVLVMRQWPGLTEREKETDPRRILQFEGKTRFGPRGRRALFLMRDDGLVDAGPLVDEEEKRLEETSP